MIEIKFDDLTDQQCADIIAHFVKRKMVGDINEIVIHTISEEITITKKNKKKPIEDVCPDCGCGMVCIV